MWTEADLAAMDPSRHLLARAFPMGFLPMTGVSTLPGRYSWVCTKAGPHGTSFGCVEEYHDLYIAPPGRPEDSRWRGESAASLIRRGDLLPRLDPDTDPATWACALRWLREQMRLDAPLAGDLVWYRGRAIPPLHARRWMLGQIIRSASDFEASISFLGVFGPFPEDTGDPGTALCHALIAVRAAR